MASFTWNVTQMNCIPQDGSYSDVVVVVHWTCVGVQDQYSASVYSTCQLPAPEGAFTPYADLTQDQVLGWMWANGVDQQATEQAVQTNIDNQINPPIVTPPLPWVQA